MIETTNDRTAGIAVIDGEIVKFEFEYYESCRNVYKRFGVYRYDEDRPHPDAWKRSTLAWLRKRLQNPDGVPGIVVADTFFWSPSGGASSRRWREKRNHDEVRAWLESEGFDDHVLLDDRRLIKRRRGEHVGCDESGTYFERRGKKLHMTLGWIKENPDACREALDDRVKA